MKRFVSFVGFVSLMSFNLGATPVENLVQALEFIHFGNFNAQNCGPEISRINQQFEEADLTWAEINPGFADKNLEEDRVEAIRTFALRANLLSRQLFTTRLTLKKEMANFFGVQGPQAGVLERVEERVLERACVPEVRKLLRLIRYAEEQLAVFLYDLYEDRSYTPQMFAGEFPDLAINPDYDSEFTRLEIRESESDKDFAKRLGINIQSGDLLVTRAKSAVSGTIARMSDIPGQHSHMILFYKDPATQDVWTLEVLLESNIRVRPLDELFDRPLGRMILFRAKPDYREKFVEAAELMWTMIRERPWKKDLEFIYDYELDGEECRPKDLVDIASLIGWSEAYPVCDCMEIICTGMIERPLSWIAPELDFPRFPSRLESLPESFKTMVGLEADEFFFPVDLEVDPHVDLVAEWRDPRVLRELQLVDLVWTSMLAWMSDPQLNYVFQPARVGDSLMSDAAVIFGKAFGLFELFGLVDHSPIASTVPQSMIRNMIVVQKATDRIIDLAREADQEFVAAQGDVVLPSFMSWAGGLKALEQIRQEDAQRWIEKYRIRSRDIEAYVPERFRPRFHHRFRTKLYPWDMKYPVGYKED